MKKKEEGITLVALVITVIILIILAAVSITVVLGENGLINKADRSVQNFATVAEEEENIMNDTRNYLIDTYLKGDNDKLIDNAQIGDYVAYNPTVTDAKGTQSVNSNLLTYTSYDNSGIANTPGSGYFIDDGNGNDAGQTFTANSNIKWRVFDIDYETGDISLISAEAIKTDENNNYYLKGPKGYLYAERELNEICKIYGFGYGANSSRVTTYNYGFSWTDGELTETIRSGARSINGDDLGEDYKNGSSSTMGKSPTIATADGWETDYSSTTYMVAYMISLRPKFTSSNSIEYKMVYRNLEDTGSTDGYWIAKRYEESDETTWYEVCYVSNSGSIQTQSLATYSSFLGNYSNSWSSGVRPIIMLRKGIKTSGKNANNEWVLK